MPRSFVADRRIYYPLIDHRPGAREPAGHIVAMWILPERLVGIHILLHAEQMRMDRASQEADPGALVISPDAEPLRLQSADASYRLSAGDRARIARGFDAGALERLLREVRPDMRSEILAYFQVSAAGERRGHLMEIHDPHLQSILEEVWAPMWDNAPAQAVEEGWYGMPGREIARARRCRP